MKLTFKIWILVIALIFSFISIFGLPPAFLQKGILITSVTSNSTAFEQGLRQNQIILSIDGQKTNNFEDFSKIISEKFSSKEKVHVVFETKDSEIDYYSNEIPQITIASIPKTNIKLGLDLAGGARALVTAEDKQLNSEEIQTLVDITSNRLNEFGLSDIKVSPVSDLSGNNFMLVEIAGATQENLEELLAKQGKFEAKIGNQTVFEGGSKDIASVSRDPQTSGIESCDESGGKYYCKFRFAVYLSQEAANKHAEITSNLDVSSENPEYLSEKLDLYLDDNLVDSLYIGVGLKGQATTQISISGSDEGATQQDALKNSEESMKKLQTILITGSLPYKLKIEKLDTISPTLGKDFIKTIFIAAGAAFLSVVIIIFFRYKKIKSSLALLFTSISEVIIILGIASLIQWNLDLASIAGILATIGTGIDQQIIVIDESKQGGESLSLKQRMKRAFAIILGAYFTSVVSLLPLYWAGAGLLKGFAVTSIIGISIGILITRPAFTDIIRKMGEKN